MGESALHQSVNVTSHTLNLCISFNWQPILDDSLEKIVTEWIGNAQPDVVRVIVTGRFEVVFFILALYSFIYNIITNTTYSVYCYAL